MFHRLVCIAVLSALVGLGAAIADPDRLKPAGWSTEQKGPMTIYSAPSSTESIMVRDITGTSDPMDGAKAIAQAVLGTGYTPTRESTSRDGPLAVYAATLSAGSKEISLSGLGIRHGPDRILAVLHMGDAADRGMAERGTVLRQALKAMASPDAANPRPAPTGTPASTPAPAPPPPPSPTRGNGLAVAHTVFDLDYVGGVGGFTYPEYTPVYLLADGRACRCTQVAPDAVTETILSSMPSSERGQWRATGGGFEIRYDDGSDQSVKPTLARPTPPPARTALSGRYTAIGGGGNTAFGGSTITAQVEDLTFHSDGSFSHEDFRYADGSGGVGWSKLGNAGTFSLDGGTLRLDYRDGRTVRTSVFYSSKRDASDEFGQLGVLWIGGESYKREE